MTTADDLHVVVGTGPLGLAVARRLAREGRRVRAVNRSGRAELPTDVELVAADAADESSLSRALEGGTVLYHCASTPYHTWPRTLPPIMAAVIGAAAGADALVVYGDNLYAYGRVAGPLTESLPYRPEGVNARTRAQIATALMDAHADGRVRATIGRASDFFGPHVLVSHMGERVFGRALAGKPASVIGDPDAPHTYTFIDDFASALVTLGAHEERSARSGTSRARRRSQPASSSHACSPSSGGEPRVRALPRPLLAMLAVVSPTLRAVREVAYQLDQPWVVDHSKFARAFGAHPTPHEAAIRDTLAWYRARGEQS